MSIIGTLIVLFIIIAVLKAIIETQRGAFLLVVMPILLLTINFSIGWENYWDGVPFPNPINPGGFIYDIIAGIIGGLLDSIIGADFFRPALAWLLGMTFYSFILAGFHVIFFNSFLGHMDFEVALGLFVLWLGFFTVFYYFHLLDDFFIFDWFSMPYKAADNIKWYYWISIVLSLFIVCKRKI